MATPSCPQEVQAVVTHLVCPMGHCPMGPQENQRTHPATFNRPQEGPFLVQRYYMSHAKYRTKALEKVRNSLPWYEPDFI